MTMSDEVSKQRGADKMVIGQYDDSYTEGHEGQYRDQSSSSERGPQDTFETVQYKKRKDFGPKTTLPVKDPTKSANDSKKRRLLDRRMAEETHIGLSENKVCYKGTNFLYEERHHRKYINSGQPKVQQQDKLLNGIRTWPKYCPRPVWVAHPHSSRPPWICLEHLDFHAGGHLLD